MLPANRYETDVVRWKTARMRLVTASGSPYGFRAEASSWNSSKKRIRRLPSATRHTLGELEREIERALRILGGKARGQRELHPLPQLAHQLHDRPRLRRGQRRAARAPGPSQRAMCRRAVGDHGGRERLGKLGRVGDAEQVELRRVGAPARQASQRRLADARLPSAPRTSHDEVGAGLEPSWHLGDVVGASDSCRPGRGESVGNRLAAGRPVIRLLAPSQESLHIICVNASHDLCKAERR